MNRPLKPELKISHTWNEGGTRLTTKLVIEVQGPSREDATPELLQQEHDEDIYECLYGELSNRLRAICASRYFDSVIKEQLDSLADELQIMPFWTPDRMTVGREAVFNLMSAAANAMATMDHTKPEQKHYAQVLHSAMAPVLGSLAAGLQ